jgi:GNAT superfamily N-acetyltransferase
MTGVGNLAAILIRPPRPAEWPACRMLVPEAFERPGSPECLLAISKAGPGIVGAAAVRWYGQLAYGLRIRVIRTEWRQGVGSRLLEAMLAEARRRGIRRMVAAAGPRIEPSAEPFLRARGFVRVNQLTTVEAPIAGMREAIGNLRRRIEAWAKIPPSARVVWLPEAPRMKSAVCTPSTSFMTRTFRSRRSRRRSARAAWTGHRFSWSAAGWKACCSGNARPTW